MHLDFIKENWILLLLVVNVGGFILLWRVLRGRQKRDSGLSIDDPQDDFDAKIEELFSTPIHRWVLSDDRRSIRLPIHDGYDLVFGVAEHEGRLRPVGPNICQIGPTVVTGRHLSRPTWDVVTARMQEICREKSRTDDKRDMYDVLANV